MRHMPSAAQEWQWGFPFPQAIAQFLAHPYNSSCLRQKKLESQMLAQWTPPHPVLGTWSGQAVRARAATSKTGWRHQDPPGNTSHQINLDFYFASQDDFIFLQHFDGGICFQTISKNQTTFGKGCLPSIAIGSVCCALRGKSCVCHTQVEGEPGWHVSVMVNSVQIHRQEKWSPFDPVPLQFVLELPSSFECKRNQKVSLERSHQKIIKKSMHR